MDIHGTQYVVYVAGRCNQGEAMRTGRRAASALSPGYSFASRQASRIFLVRASAGSVRLCGIKSTLMARDANCLSIGWTVSVCIYGFLSRFVGQLAALVGKTDVCHARSA